jgi:hypothetical protein
MKKLSDRNPSFTKRARAGAPVNPANTHLLRVLRREDLATAGFYFRNNDGYGYGYDQRPALAGEAELNSSGAKNSCKKRFATQF